MGWLAGLGNTPTLTKVTLLGTGWLYHLVITLYKEGGPQPGTG